MLIPARQALDDGASSYAGDGADGPGARTRTPSQDPHEWARAIHRHQKVWDRNKEQRLAWRRQGRSRDYRWPEHYEAWEAEEASSTPPAGSELWETIRKTEATLQAKVDAVERARREKEQAQLAISGPCAAAIAEGKAVLEATAKSAVGGPPSSSSD